MDLPLSYSIGSKCQFFAQFRSPLALNLCISTELYELPAILPVVVWRYVFFYIWLNNTSFLPAAHQPARWNWTVFVNFALR